MVFRVLLRLTGDRENVDDLAQEVFLRFYRAWAKFRGEAQVSTYLYRIAVNVAKDEWKRRRQAVTVPADFAARVAKMAPAKRAVTATPRYGMWAAQAAMVLLVAGLIAVSRDRSVAGVALQWVLCAELAGLAVWKWGLGKMLL